jgi:transcriptional regulator with XRE-family HTH domain
MNIGERIRALREEKNFSQGVMQKRSGLLRSYLSRIENNHSIPSLATLEKLARALECPLYQLVYDGDQPPHLLPKLTVSDGTAWGSSRKDAKFLRKIRHLLGKTDDEHRRLLLAMARKMSER